MVRGSIYFIRYVCTSVDNQQFVFAEAVGKGKMKKILTFSVILFALFLTSCHASCTFPFMHPTEEISEIAVVDLSYVENGDVLQTELIAIEDVDGFLTEFRKVTCYVYFGDPSRPYKSDDSTIVIRVTCANGEYQLIGFNGQCSYTLDHGLNIYDGIYCYRENEFMDFVRQYWSPETTAEE